MNALLDVIRCFDAAWVFVPQFEYPAEAAGLLGYVGPGAGLSMLGALFAVACVFLLALLGPILYPIHLLRSWLRKRREQTASPSDRGEGDAVVAEEAEPGMPSDSRAEEVYRE